MAQWPSLIFDKSSLESLNVGEAVLLDNFYMSNITPLFFVECLADLEKSIRSNSTPEQLVGSLANRTPEMQGVANVHHMKILLGELTGQFNLRTVFERPLVGHGQSVQLGEMKGVIFRPTEEQEALQRWRNREFLEVERTIAKKWRAALNRIDLDAMAAAVMTGIGGHLRRPKTLEDAKHLTEVIIDSRDPEWLMSFGIDLLGVPDANEAGAWVIQDWIKRRRPPIREHLPYFVFMLSINIFFCLTLPTELLKNVKASHQVDLAYLYYLPFCSVFTSKDNFHAQVVPLFLDPHQTFINGIDLKEDLRKLDQFYSASEEVRRQGLMTFAAVPPQEDGLLIAQLWDKYLPAGEATNNALISTKKNTRNAHSNM